MAEDGIGSICLQDIEAAAASTPQTRLIVERARAPLTSTASPGVSLRAEQSRDRTSSGNTTARLPCSLRERYEFIREISERRPKFLGTAGDRKRYKLDFEEVQLIRLRELKYQLACDVRDAQFESKALADTDFDQNMAAYVQAQQILDRLKGDCHQHWSLMDERINTKDRELMDELLGNVSTARIHAGRRGGKADAKSEQRPTLRNELAWFIERVLLSWFTSFFFVFPMFGMILAGWDTTNDRLVVTATSIMVFCFLTSLIVGERKDVLGITAAYAAVLVVFVGLTEK